MRLCGRFQCQRRFPACFYTYIYYTRIARESSFSTRLIIDLQLLFSKLDFFNTSLPICAAINHPSTHNSVNISQIPLNSFSLPLLHLCQTQHVQPPPLSRHRIKAEVMPGSHAVSVSLSSPNLRAANSIPRLVSAIQLPGSRHIVLSVSYGQF